MPIYDYDCPSCGNTFEERKGWDDNPAAFCSKCGTQAVKRFATPAIVYKGSGFYTTDYKASSSPSSSSKDSSSSSGNGKTAKETTKNSNGSKPASTDKSTTSAKSKND